MGLFNFFKGFLYESYYFGVLGPGFLNQVATLHEKRALSWDIRLQLSEAWGLRIWEFPKNRGPEYSTLNSRILIRRTPK